MKASYIATILLSATLTLAAPAPAKVDDVLVSSNTSADLGKHDRNLNSDQPIPLSLSPNSGSLPAPALNNIGTIIPSGSSSGVSPDFPVSMPGLPSGGQSQPARPAEYVSGALRQHNPKPRALGDLSSLPVVGDMADSAVKSASNSNSNGRKNPLPKANGVVDMLKNPTKGNADPLDTIMGSEAPATSAVSEVLGQSRSGKKRLARRDLVELGSDHLGRTILKRGNEFMLQEPADQGRQWEGADELDDENDEPFWG
ncbi:hypothetical protein IAU59_001707 [Kwoniella sp. CBS 9459]